VYTVCEVGVIWIGAEVFERKYCDSLCYADLLGRLLTFAKRPTNRYRQGNQHYYERNNGCLRSIHLRDAFVTSEQSLSTVRMSGRRERALSLTASNSFQTLRPNYTD
jgi:hypothetical protein